MNSPAQPADLPASPTVPPRSRPSAAERVAQAEADFAAGRRNPFARVDPACLTAEGRAKLDAWQREVGFDPVK